MMQVRAAAIVMGLIAAGAPALAVDSPARTPGVPAAARPSAHTIAVNRPRLRKTLVAAVPGAAVEVIRQSGRVLRRRAAKAIENHKAGREAGLLATPEGDPLAAAVNFSTEAVGWRLIEDPATGARLGLPEKLVPRAGAARTGSHWSSAQGQIQVETFRLSEAALPALFEQEKKAPHRYVASSELKPDSFVIIGVQGLKNLFIRAQARGSEVRGVTVLYDQATEGTMDRVAAAMMNAFSGFPDPNAAPLPGWRRAVEYGSAIVVTSAGDLIAPAHVTDGCQAITVPGFGHAERVAADKANDVALLRLYGARNLVPATLTGDSEQTGDFKLVGIADPLAQAGGVEVSVATAHLSAQAIEPVPKPGFSGAAAVDPGGGLVGMVDLKPSVIAGSSSASPGAVLVPADAIRAFLQRQGISPSVATAEHPAIEQSVVRVICVRK
jgi:hypothetical protein